MSPSLVVLLNSITLFKSTDSQARPNNECTTNAVGKGPVASPDTAHNFLRSKELAFSADNAPTPSNYTKTFGNLKAAIQTNGYLGYAALETYDTNACAAKCTATAGCQGINIYFERDPSKLPGPSCANPPSTTVIKCTLWGVHVTEENATNLGQKNNDFMIAVAGSNGYNREANGILHNNAYVRL